MAGKKKVPIIYEDDSIIVCEKPAGMPVQPDTTKNIDLETYFKNYLFQKQAGEEEPYLTAVHRLDRSVGGLMVFAKTKQAAANLSEQIQNHEFEKYYQAVVCGTLPEDFGTFEDVLLRDGKTNTTKVVPAGTPGARDAALDYELIDQIETKEGTFSWVLVILSTGRHHQIRVQFASRGLGLYGDTKYNPRYQKMKKKYMQLGLYSTRLEFCHPVTGEKVVFKTEPQGEAFEMMDVEAF
ncbi:MAG: RNA pseudouridine synthase [Clostridiales bacterium]|nr:RNA pseudouridine synthase [Clostridiales bacterium]